MSLPVALCFLLLGRPLHVLDRLPDELRLLVLLERVSLQRSPLAR